MPADTPWLSRHTAAGVELNTCLLAEVLRAYRTTNGLNQADLAQLLSMDQSYVSKIETGQRQIRDVEMLLHIAQQLDIPPGQLGLSNELLHPLAPSGTSTSVGEVDPVKSNQQEWRRSRRTLNRSRRQLARDAACLYHKDVRVNDLPFMAPSSWLPATPVPLDSICLEWCDEVIGAEVTGTEPEACNVLPLRASGRRYSRYTSAIRYLDPPALLENRPSYRLLDVGLAGVSERMKFGLATYFDKLDLTEAVAHELAEAQANGRIGWNHLPLRALVGDPFDLRRRFVMPAIETLTLRRQRGRGRGSFLLHWRDPAKVATAAGIYGLIPAGEFQPSTIAGWDRKNDFSLWRSLVREYSEELLGEPERDGTSGEPLDYDNWPLYRDLERAREQGRVTPYCLGLGLDTLTLTATILTVTVMDDDVFDELFGESVRINAEGVLVTAAESSSVSDGVPFDEECVRRLLDNEPMASPAMCILQRSWRFRRQLLGQ